MIKNKLLVLLFTSLIIIGLTLPSHGEEVVKIQKIYSYDILTKDLDKLSKSFPNLISYKSIGTTPFNRDIWAVKLGTGNTNVLFTGAMHAREWISTILIMKLIENYASAYAKGEIIYDYNVEKLLNKTSIWFVPMVNPDGVTLQQFGLRAFPKEVHKELLIMNDSKSDFKRWKANAQGIDLNRQFPSDWDNKESNIYKPYYWNFKGTYPLQALEAQALAKFTEEIKPEILLSYHSSGRIIYWFSSFASVENQDKSKEIAIKYANFSGYKLVDPDTSPGAANFFDYFIKKYAKLSLTIELSKRVGETHVPIQYFPDIWQKNKQAGLFIANEAYRIVEERKQKNIPMTILFNGLGIESHPKEAFRNLDMRTLVPISLFTENNVFGLNNPAHTINENEVSLKLGDKSTLTFTANSNICYFNAHQLIMDTNTQLINGQFFVPLRYVAECLGLKIRVLAFDKVDVYRQEIAE